MLLLLLCAADPELSRFHWVLDARGRDRVLNRSVDLCSAALIIGRTGSRALPCCHRDAASLHDIA